jgi:hypothetical protein
MLYSYIFKKSEDLETNPLRSVVRGNCLIKCNILLPSINVPENIKYIQAKQMFYHWNPCIEHIRDY